MSLTPPEPTRPPSARRRSRVGRVGRARHPAATATAKPRRAAAWVDGLRETPGCSIGKWKAARGFEEDRVGR
jgi:hypothetical protein